IIEQILVKVNGEIFTKTELEARQVAAIRGMGRDVDPTDLQLRQMLDQVTPDLLVSVVDEMLIVQRGKELGYRLADDQFQNVIDSIKKDNKIESDEQFQAALKQENMTLADLRRQIEKQMIVSRVQQNEILGRVAVSDEEARRYYDSHPQEFTSPQEVTLREIFVNVANDGKTLNVGLDEEAKAKAAQIRERVLAGEPFEKLAADLSDAPSRANAGLIGPLNLADVSSDVRTLIESMSVGQVSELLRSSRGYQILKLESITPPQTKSFEEAKEEISNRVFTDKRQGELDKYLEKLRAEAIIEWKNPDLKKAYDQGRARSKTLTKAQ
ncbi:MAG: peptidyl-prolyl cis-trans isomerase, partial [Vicinamibacterales bacterium]